MSASRPIRILVIDERPDARKRIVSALQTASAPITAYDIGSSLGATSILARLGIDVLVIGPQVATMPGKQFARLVRNNPRVRRVKIILCVPDLPSLDAGSREFEHVDAVVAETTLAEALPRAFERLVRLPLAVARGATASLANHRPALADTRGAA